MSEDISPLVGASVVRAAKVLEGEGFSIETVPSRYSHESLDDYRARVIDMRFAALYDSDGEVICQIPRQFLEDLAAVSDADLKAILLRLGLAVEAERHHAFKRGVRSGRAEVINEAHELLGIDRLVDAIGEATSRIADRLRS